MFPDGTPRPEPVGLADLPDGRPHPLATATFTTLFGENGDMLGRWRPRHQPTVRTVKAKCGSCGAWWFDMWSDRPRQRPNIRYRWATPPAGQSPTTLEVWCSCGRTSAVNLAKLEATVGFDNHEYWARRGEVIIGQGRYASRYPDRLWPRSRPAVSAGQTAH